MILSINYNQKNILINKFQKLRRKILVYLKTVLQETTIRKPVTHIHKILTILTTLKDLDMDMVVPRGFKCNQKWPFKTEFNLLIFQTKIEILAIDRKLLNRDQFLHNLQMHMHL